MWGCAASRHGIGSGRVVATEQNPLPDVYPRHLGTGENRAERCVRPGWRPACLPGRVAVAVGEAPRVALLAGGRAAGSSWASLRSREL